MRRATSVLWGICAVMLVLAVPARPASVTVGEPLPPWTPGTLDIHQIETGRGNAALFEFPDGTTMLLDAGDAGDVSYADPRPDGTRSPAEWIVHYVKQMLGNETKLDYAVLTHFHPDHMGTITGKEPKSKSGDYHLRGLTEVAEEIPIATMVDRGYDYLTPKDPLFLNYRAFVGARSKDGMRVLRAEAGSAAQIVPVRKPGSITTPFEVRVVAVNDRVWTGEKEETKVRFPPLESIAVAEDRPNENMCSVALRVRYGKFDYFTGGDMPGYPVPGAPAWHDLETDVAKAIGPTDVHVVNHHGSIEEENLFWLATLRSRVMIVPAWSATHPSPDVLKRMLSKRVYPDPRDIFVTLLREPTKAAIGPRASQVTSDHGHVVVRVEPGGAHYQVVVLDESTLRVTSVHGPYDSM